MLQRHRAFADAYLADAEHNATRAYLKVHNDQPILRDSAKRRACIWLNRPDVQEYIRKKTEKTNEKAELSIVELKKFIKSVMDGEVKDNEIVNGQIVEKPTRVRDRLTAAKLYGDCLGAYTSKVDIEGGLNVVISGTDEVSE